MYLYHSKTRQICLGFEWSNNPDHFINYFLYIVTWSSLAGKTVLFSNGKNKKAAIAIRKQAIYGVQWGLEYQTS
jgi:hypothetical protein